MVALNITSRAREIGAQARSLSPAFASSALPFFRCRAGSNAFLHGGIVVFSLFATFLRVHFLRARSKKKPAARRAIGHEQLESRRLLTGPTANSDNYYVSDGTINIPGYAGVLANDTGGDGPLSAVLISGPSYGSLTLNSDGSFEYSNTSYTADDSFTYEAYDGTTYSPPTDVSISIGPGMYEPQVAPNTYSVLHGNTLTVSAADGVLAGASDPNNLHLTLVPQTGVADGSLTLNSDGSFNYTPVSTFAGTDSFTIEVHDGNSYSFPTTEQINVSEMQPSASDDNYSLLNTQTLNVDAANGVLSNDSSDSPLTAALYSGPSNGSLTFNSDGSFSYTPNPGWIGTDTFQYTVNDGVSTNGPATVSLTTDYGVASVVDQTKLPVNTIDVSRQILSDPFGSPITSPLPAGGSGGTTINAAPADGAPATAHNLALAYDSILAAPDQVVEADVGFSSDSPIDDTLSAALTFNGVAQPDVYFDMNTMGGGSHVHVAIQVDTSGLASGRYPYSLTINGGKVASPATITGYVNVVNDSASTFGAGWDMPGLYRLFQNNVPGVAAGVLLSTGDGGAWYFTQNDDGSYASPAGAFAFSTLTNVMGGWQLVDKYGTTFNFDSEGDLTSRVERTGETTSYNWMGNELTSIVDQFGRAVNLGYTNALLSSITDFAGSVWNFADTGSDLTSITEPDPGGGSPVWQFAYSGNYLLSVTDPNQNETDYTLDSFHRLSGTALPGGGSTSDTGEQDFGYGSTDSNSPANLTLASSVTPTSTDADGNQWSYETNQFGQTISQISPDGSVTTIQRDANGLPTQVTLPPPTTGAAAPVTIISYDATGDETSATGAQPTYGTYTYAANSFGQWATFTDSTGNEWTRTFDASGNILSETDPSGAVVTWSYDAYGRPLTMTMPAPNDGAGTVTTQYFYDADERLTKILWPDAATELSGYNADDYQTSYQDENEHTTATSLDALNRPTLVTDALNHSVATTYDNDSNVLTTENQLGQVTANVYNSANELVQRTLPDPDGNGPLPAPVLSFTYSPTGEELTETDGLGRTTSFSYDQLDRRASETLPDPDGAGPLSSPVITFGYDNLSRQTSQMNALGGTTLTTYGNSDINQVTSVTLPAPSGSGSGPATSYFYDADGRPDQVENALGEYTTRLLTVDGQTSSVKDNLGNKTVDAYGNGGELLSTTDALNHTTSDKYDSRYRLVQTTAADGGVTQTVLDPVGNRVKLVDPDNNETDWTYSATNLPLTETNSLGTTTTAYDAASHITSIEDADGRVRDFVYDKIGRLTAENWMQGGTIIAGMNYGYDAADELVSAGDTNSAYAFAYNGDGKVTSVDNAGTPNMPDVVLANTYDLMGDRTSQLTTIAGTPDYLNSYSYGADQHLTMVQQQGQTGGNAVSPKEIDYGYNALGQFSTVADFNFIGVGPRTDVLAGVSTYDGDDRLTGLAYTSSGGQTAIDTLGWGYDVASNVTSFTSVDGEAKYGYDATNQLTSTTYTTASGGHQPANEDFSFDSNGNRAMAGYSTGSDNLLTSDGTFNYQQDADGSTTVRTRISNDYASDYRTTYSWDYRNRLTDVEYFDNNSVLTKHVHFVYDVFDHLIATEADTSGSGQYDSIERYVLDVSPETPAAGVPGTVAAEPVLQFDGAQHLTARFFVGLDPTGVSAVVAQEAVSSLNQGGQVVWAADDNLGTPRDEVDTGGALANHNVFSVFGQKTYSSDPGVAFWAGFGGGHFDLFTGDVNDYHRWYDPPSGRWLSADPKGQAAGDANLQRYARNDPLGVGDRTGLQPDIDWNSLPGIRAYVDIHMTVYDPSWRVEAYRSKQIQAEQRIDDLTSEVAGAEAMQEDAARVALDAMSHLGTIQARVAFGGNAGASGTNVAVVGQFVMRRGSILSREFWEATKYEKQLKDAQDQQAAAADVIRRLQAQIDEEHEYWDQMQKNIDDLTGG